MMFRRHICVYLLWAVLLTAGCWGESRPPADIPCRVAAGVPETADAAEAMPDTIPAVLSAVQSAGSCAGDTAHVLCHGLVTCDSAVVLEGGGVSLQIDSGAVSTAVEVSVSRVAAGDGVLDGFLQNVTYGGGVVRLLPDGQRFDKAVTLAMPYDTAALPCGYSPGDIHVYTYDGHARQWVRVAHDSVDTAGCTLYAYTTHFSDYVAAVLREPDGNGAVQYTPTVLSDMPEAHPMDGLTFMAPPEVGSDGAAALEYPLSLPAGRRGMAPRLVVRYHSGGGGGILGQGWSMPVSEISVDTRWGVPRYDTLFESEDYLLDGAPLTTASVDNLGLLRLRTPVHRRTYEARQTGDVRYYLRVEGAFRRIVRHGNGPGDYWWEVTDKDGTRHIYGQSTLARLTDGRRTARWLLERSVDPWGNTVDYRYRVRYSSGGVEGTGRQVLLEKIRYSGNLNADDPGHYRVRLRYAEKADAGLSFRYGFQEDDGVVLDRIEVFAGAQRVGDCWFGYRRSALGKTLLCCIAEGRDDRNRLARLEDPAGSGHYSSFGPYDRCEVKQSYVGLTIRQYTRFDYHDLDGPLYGDAVAVTEQGGVENLYGVSGLLWDDGGRIGGSLSGGWSLSGGLNVGVGVDAWLKTLTVGGHYSHSRDKSWGLVTLADLDGDGLPDKLYLDHAGHLRVRRHLSGQNAFGAPETVDAPGCFLRVESRSDSWGAEANAAVIAGGLSWTENRANTTAYLTDIDGDGLLDIVDGNRVYRNAGNLRFTDVTASDTLLGWGDCGGATRFDGEVDEALFSDGVYTVSRVVCSHNWSKVTVCDTLLLAGGSVDTVICHDETVLVSEDCDTVIDTIHYTFPRQYEPDIDLVRMWVAPYDGSVSVDGEARMSDSLAAVRAATHGTDGVWVAVQRAQDTVPLTQAVVTADSVRRIGCDADVSAGDTLYFRVNALGSRRFDEVEWTPRIRYTHAVLRDGTVVTDSVALRAVDAVGDSIYRFDYATDYLLSAAVPVSVGDSSGASCWNRFAVRSRVRSTLPQNLPLHYRIDAVTLDTVAARTPLTTVALPAGRIFDTVLADTVTVPAGSGLLPRLCTNSGGPVRWGAVEAAAEVSLVESGSAWLSGLLGDSAARKTYVYHPVVEITHHDYLAIPGEAVPTYAMPSDRSVTFSAFTVSGAPFSGTLPLMVRYSLGNMVCTVHFQNGAASLTLPAQVQAPALYFDFHTGSSAVSDSIASLTVDLGGVTRRAALYAVRGGGRHHGTLYRGWGQFGYKNEPGVNYIRRSRTLPPSWYSDTSALPRPSVATLTAMANDTLYVDTLCAGGPETTLDSLYNPLSDNFFEMHADGAGGCWRSYGDALTAGRAVQSLDPGDAARKYGAVAEADATQSPLPLIEPGVPLKAVGKLTVSSSRGSTVSRVSWSRGDSRLVSDYTDLNGDGYPDVVSETGVHYSKVQGGLGTTVVRLGGGSLHAENLRSAGAASDGTFLSAIHQAACKAKAGRVVTAVTGLAQLLSGSLTYSTSAAVRTLADLNGDGLPDIVNDDGTVRYNTGYGFAAPRQSLLSPIAPRMSRDESRAVGAAFNIGATSIAGGISGNASDNSTGRMLVDVTGDGLPDWVDGGYVRVNRGDGVFSYGCLVGDDKGSGESLSGTATVTADAVIPLLFLTLKVGGSVGGGVTGALNGTDGQYVDFDGDGCADYVSRDDGNGITVRLNRAAKSGLLKRVSLPTRAIYDIDYTLSSATVESPRRQWQMTSLKVYDGYGEDSGEDTLFRNIKYHGRRYDRAEREDLGYAEAEVLDYASRQDWIDDRPLRVTGHSWLNGCWRLHGLPGKETVSDLSTGASRHTRYHWGDADLRDGHWHSNSVAAWCRGDAWPALESEETTTLEGDGGAVVTRREYTYGPWGNVTYVHDRGDIADAGDDLFVEMEYQSADEAAHIVGNVTAQTVTDADGDTLRLRRAAYNAAGAMDTLEVRLDSAGTTARWRLVYDSYGNTDTLFTPQTDSTEHDAYWLHYTYDNATHSLPERTADAEGYYSVASYDHRWQKPGKVWDIGGTELNYDYDCFGRLTTVVTERDRQLGAPYSVRYDYWNSDSTGWLNYSYPELVPGMAPGNEHHYALWARTACWDERHPSNDLETVTLSDGLGRVMQSKEEVETAVEGMGRRVFTVVHDVLGREEAELFPFFEPSSSTWKHLNPQASPWRVYREYDGWDRVRRIHHADGTEERADYNSGADSAGVTRQRLTVTDRAGHETRSLLNHRGLTLQVTDARGGVTQLCYDALGRIQSTTDPEGYSVIHRYDMGGRRVERRHPASGVTRWHYDAAGNITAEVSDNGDSVGYRHHYGRLAGVTHNRTPWNDARYRYGAPLQGGASGRVVERWDASGVTRYGYDGQGNVTRERRTCVFPGSRDPVTLITEWDYDSRGRVLRVVYPDSETVTYVYNQGGALRRVDGIKPGQSPVSYIGQIGYNIYGQRVFESDGDGVETEYSYDSLTLRLKRMRVMSLGTLTLLSDLHYSYDLCGNIVSVVDSGANARVQTFVYDSLHRLTQSEGTGSWGGASLWYGAAYRYSASGRLLQKERYGWALDNMLGVHAVDADLKYTYPVVPDNPYGAKDVWDSQHNVTTQFNWNGRGEMERAESPERSWLMCWDEEGRLQSAYHGDDRGQRVSWYGYDGAGARAVRMTGEAVTLTQNGVTETVASLTEPVVYPSPLVTLTKRGYTKHYFEGERRICSAVGGGFSLVEWDTTAGFSSKMERTECHALLQQLEEGVSSAMRCVDVETSYVDAEGIMRMLKDQHQKMHDDPDVVFFYHLDHLGGTSYLTDRGGQVAQTLAYLPYGENWVDVTTFMYDTSQVGFYQFNGKERDPETGFLYYGARYYWPELWTGWLSVDPLIDKYPGISPYNYCNLNPVNLVDPDGREMDDWELKNNGCLIWDKETHGNVVDRIVAEDGSYVVVPSGVLAKDDQDGGGNYLHAGAINFTIDKMENAFEIFEFLADKSSVEYSLIGLSQSEESGTINTYKIFSSMDPNGDRFGTVESYKMAEKGRLRIHIHNHPNGTSSPSNAINSKGKGNDSQFEKNIMKIQNNKPCSFYIYSSKQNGIYRRYGDNSGLIINSSVSKGLHYFYSK